MAFFDELGSKLTQTGKKTKEMASNLMDAAKVNNQLGDLNKEIQTLYTQLGELYYKTCGDAPDAALAELCAQVRAKEEAVAAARADLQRLKNVKVCPDCGHENQPNANFCAHCSAKLPELPKPEPAVGGFCPGCGAPLGPNDHFCGKCGARLD